MSFKATTLFIVRLVVSNQFKQQQQQRQFSNCYNKWNKIVPLFNSISIPTLKSTCRNRFDGDSCLKHSVAVSLGRSTRVCNSNKNNNNNSSSGNIRGRSSSSTTTSSSSSLIKELIKVKMPEAKQFERLPTNVKPVHYNLTIKPDLKKCTFQGEVSIQIEVGSFISSFFCFILIFFFLASTYASY